MLNNALNRSDLRHLVNRLRRQGLRKAASQLLGRRGDRVAEFWSTVEHEPIHAWNVPSVLRRRNVLITGDESTSHVDYFVSTYLADVGPFVRCRSAAAMGRGVRLGADRTVRQDRWLRRLRARRRSCASRAEAEGLDDVLRFRSPTCTSLRTSRTASTSSSARIPCTT